MARPYGASLPLYPSFYILFLSLPRPAPPPLFPSLTHFFLSLPSSLPPSRSPSLLSVPKYGSEKPVQQFSYLLHLRHTNIVRNKISNWCCVSFFVLFLLKILKPALGQQRCCWLLVAGCWSRGKHLLRERVQVRSRPSVHVNKTVEEHTFT